jgi:hypothetical protein
MKYMCELCTHPNYINIVDENEKKYDISINEINYIKLDSSIRLVQFFKRTYRRINDFFYCRIRIPIKRYVALPNDDTADNLIICPGGAEQNLALLHYVNKHRWHPDSSMKIGISENHFDDYHNTNFQIGTEGFVYGITNNMKGRELRNNRNRAEIMSFDIGDTKIVSIYGYSAPMTKIASLKFIDCLANDNYKYIPWKRTTINNHLQYVVNYTGRSFFSSKEIEYWDNEDMLNYKSIDLECIKEKFTNINLEAYDYE